MLDNFLDANNPPKMMTIIIVTLIIAPVNVNSAFAKGKPHHTHHND